MNRTITLESGEKLYFEPLTYNEQHLIKVNLNGDGSANGEGIWAVVSASDKADCDNDTKSGKFIAMLANHALCFHPNPSWGLHVVVEHRGTNRPVADMTWVDYSKETNRIWSNDTPKEHQL